MFWFRRPPYLRLAAGSALIALALFIELRPAPIESIPFAATDIAAGERLGSHNTELREVPEGVLGPVDMIDTRALLDITEGEPIVQSMIGDDAPLEPGWWGVEIDAPAGVVPGTELRLVLGDEIVVPATVVSLRTETGFGISSAPALVAIPSEMAAAVAGALRDQHLRVLIAGW